MMLCGPLPCGWQDSLVTIPFCLPIYSPAGGHPGCPQLPQNNVAANILVYVPLWN